MDKACDRGQDKPWLCLILTMETLQVTPALNPYSLINAATINGLPAFLLHI